MTVVMTVVIQKRRPKPSSRAARRVGNRTIPRHELGGRIQKTALQLFRERGFDNISVDEIVATSGVAKGTFFNFFPTKQAVLSGYYRDLDSFMTARLRRLNPADPAKSLVNLFRAMEHQLRAEGDLACVLFREITQNPTLGATDFDSGLDDLQQYTSFFEKCRANGSIDKSVIPHVAAEMVQDLWSSTAQRWFRMRQRFSLGSVLRLKLETLFAGLKCRAAGS
jgi:AcrR family transcriptional regulator